MFRANFSPQQFPIVRAHLANDLAGYQCIIKDFDQIILDKSEAEIFARAVRYKRD